MIIAAWALQLLGIGLSAAFLATYTVTAWKPWLRRKQTSTQRAARQLLLSLPVMLLSLLTPGAINAALGHTMVFSSPSSVAGKAIAVALLWFPWRLWWKARP
jgi:hypothetical protein